MELFSFLNLNLGGDPRLVFFDSYNTEVKTINISNMDPDTVATTLAEHGFPKFGRS